MPMDKTREQTLNETPDNLRRVVVALAVDLELLNEGPIANLPPGIEPVYFNSADGTVSAGYHPATGQTYTFMGSDYASKIQERADANQHIVAIEGSRGSAVLYRDLESADFEMQMLNAPDNVTRALSGHDRWSLKDLGLIAQKLGAEGAYSTMKGNPEEMKRVEVDFSGDQGFTPKVRVISDEEMGKAILKSGIELYL